MAEGLLRLCDAAGVFGDHPGISVARLMDVNLLDAGLSGVALQVVRKGVRGELRARPPARSCLVHRGPLTSNAFVRPQHSR